MLQADWKKKNICMYENFPKTSWKDVQVNVQMIYLVSPTPILKRKDNRHTNTPLLYKQWSFLNKSFERKYITKLHTVFVVFL